MMSHPLDENRRLAILRRYAILDTPPEDLFDRVARMAARHFKTPIGTVTFVDEGRQWFKAMHGLDVRETSRDVAFCHYTIQSSRPLLIGDALRDVRFQANPLVTGPPFIRFYAGAPLVTSDGWRLGTVSAIDTVPHPELTASDCDHLADLAALVVHELEMRLAASEVQSDMLSRAEADRRLHMAIRRAPVILATLDSEGRYTWIANPPSPMTERDFLGHHDRELWPPGIVARLEAMGAEGHATGRAQHAEFSVEIAGEIRHYDVTVEPLNDGTARAAIDVTERKRAEMALTRLEARHRAVLATAADAMLVIDPDGAIEHFNQAAERIFGYRSAEVIGRDVTLLIPDGLASHQTELVGWRKDAMPVPLESSISAWWDGGRRYLTVILRDITRRRRSEAALRKAEAERAESLTLLHTVLESIPDPLFCKDRDGRYIVANSATAAALGTDSVVGKTDYDLLPREQADRLRAADREVMESGTPKVVEEAVHAEGAEVRWYLAAKIPLRYHNGAGAMGIVGLARDVTERRAMMDQLRQAKDEAEAASRAKTSFLAAASHDLRQPVQALLLFTTALEGRLKDHPAAAILVRMRRSLDALGMLLESLLDISRLDAGAVSVSPQACPLTPLLEQVMQEYALPARRKGLRLRVVPCCCWTVTDPSHLARVVRNLVENAIRYTERGGILVGCRRKGGRLRLQVIDTGIGIPEDKIAAIFQEFLQLANPERDRTKGLGLGLSIVRRMLALLGHELRVTSVPERGSCFSIDLPEAPPGTVAAAPPAHYAPAPACKSVMVIDDEAIVRQGLQLLLGDWRHRVITAADAEEAVRRAIEEGPPDVIVADYRLQGGRTGTEAVEAVRGACNKRVPAIIITGDTAPERIAEVRRSGNLMAHKPVSGDALQRLIAAAVQSRT